jgi:hypothetical protein
MNLKITFDSGERGIWALDIHSWIAGRGEIWQAEATNDQSDREIGRFVLKPIPVGKFRLCQADKTSGRQRIRF